MPMIPPIGRAKPLYVGPRLQCHAINRRQALRASRITKNGGLIPGTNHAAQSGHLLMAGSPALRQRGMFVPKHASALITAAPNCESGATQTTPTGRGGAFGGGGRSIADASNWSSCLVSLRPAR